MSQTTTDQDADRVQAVKFNDGVVKKLRNVGFTYDEINDVIRLIIQNYLHRDAQAFPVMAGVPEVEPLVHEKVTFDSGAQRSKHSAGARPGRPEARFDLAMMNTVAFRRWAEAFGEGVAKGYGPNNWMLGMPESKLVEHMQAHMERYLDGETSSMGPYEDHLAHAFWNIGTLMFMQERRPEMLDLTGKDNNKKIDN